MTEVRRIPQRVATAKFFCDRGFVVLGRGPPSIRVRLTVACIYPL